MKTEPSAENSRSKLGLRNRLVKGFFQLSQKFKEKPKPELDEFTLEHFLLYHGLVGSSPENQRSFRDIRVDILDAVKNRSATALGITLKLPPLWWGEKLDSVFAELADKREIVISLLCSEKDSSPSLLSHDDWRVRSNAAHILAFFKATDCVKQLTKSLEESAQAPSAAFCHIARALGKIGDQQSVQALAKYLQHDEPWCRVDVAAALALEPFDSVKGLFSKALLVTHPLSDYTAVVITQYHPLLAYLNDESPAVQDGGCELVIGLINAADRTFSTDTALEAKLPNSLSMIRKLAANVPSPRRLHTLIALTKWIQQHEDDIEETNPVETALRQSSLSELLPNNGIDQLKTRLPKDLLQSRGAELQHILYLVGELRITAAASSLIQLLDPNQPELDQVVEALGKLGDAGSAEPLVNLANKLVSIEDRTQRSKSKNPVVEDNDRNSKVYWQLLRAMGSLPTKISAALLLRCVNDFAPDKREQALLSLISIAKTNADLAARDKILEALTSSMSDASPHVRLAALQGAGTLNTIEIINDIVRQVDAKEVSVARQANQTLTTLNLAGHKTIILQALQRHLDKERDEYKRQRLKEIMEVQGR